MATYQIIAAGPITYNFQDIRGTVLLAEEGIAITERDGVADHALRKTGVRARPTNVTAIEYFASTNDAATNLAAYQALNGTTVTLVQAGVSYTLMEVLSVQLAGELVPTGAVAGSLVANPIGRMTTRWTLKARSA